METNTQQDSPQEYKETKDLTDERTPESVPETPEEKPARRRTPKAIVLYIIAIAVLILLITAFRCNLISLRIGNIYIGKDSGSIGVQATSKLNQLESAMSDFYFDIPDKQDSIDAIARAYVESYDDPYTVYYTAEEFSAFMQSSEGISYGIGVIVGKTDDGSLLITRVISGGPAEEAGLQAGDLITAVDGESILEEDIEATVQRIKGDDGTDVTLTIVRDGQTMDVTVTRGQYDIPLVSYGVLDGNIGYIYLAEFDASAEQQFLDAYQELTEVEGVSALVIDLRGNPGGLLNVDTDILDELLPDGDIVTVRDKAGNEEVVTGTNPNQIEIPLAVLVNGESASASELFAAAIQDYQVGVVVGTQTYGKGIAQTIKQFSDGSGVKYTIEKYFTPNGRDIHGTGVTPDIVVETAGDGTEDANPETDTQLAAALSYLNGELSQ
ncbi:MAG: S41 family peptidase [Lachnospiraceae bacterium]